MKSREIPFIRPTFPSSKDLISDYETIVNNNWYTNFGPFEKKFRLQLEKFIGQEVSVSTVNNATSGLIAAVLAVLGKGDGSLYIVVPSFTFVAGPQAIVWCGYKPLFVDIDPTSLQTNLGQTRKVVVERRSELAAVLLCNTLGVGDPLIDEWESMCENAGLPLIIDSAAGFGSRYKNGGYIGAKGDCEIFSFHATKPFAVGEGGAVVSRDKAIISRIDSIQNFGFEKPRDSAYLGLNGKLQEVNAAIGLKQLEGFESRLASRGAALKLYKEAFASTNILFQTNAENSSSFCCSIILPDHTTKERIFSLLQASGVQARDYYNPLVSEQSYFSQNNKEQETLDLSVSKDIASRIISLPIHDSMDPSDLTHITNIVMQGLR